MRKMMKEKMMRNMLNEKIMRKKKMIMVKMIKKSDSLSQIFSIRSCAGGRKQRRREKRLKKVDILPFSFFSTSHLSKSKKGVDILCKERIGQSISMVRVFHFEPPPHTTLTTIWLSSFLRPFYPPNISQYGYNLGNLKKGIGVLCNETFQLL